MQPTIAVIGGGLAMPKVARRAEAVGAAIARSGARLICGGLGGVMEAACRGAKEAGGQTVGILPGFELGDANEFVDVPIATGLGEVRNLVILRSADAAIAVDGRFGTLTEIAFALQLQKPVVGMGTWSVNHPSEGIEDPVLRAEDPDDAVRLALEAAGITAG